VKKWRCQSIYNILGSTTLLILIQSRPWSHLAKFLQIYIFYTNMIRIDTEVKIITLTTSGNKVKFIHSFIRSFVRPSVRPSVRSFIRSFVHSFIHSLSTPFWLATYDLWLWLLSCWRVMTMTLGYVNKFKVLPMTGEDIPGLVLCKLISLCLQL